MSKDGGAFANIGTLPVEISTTGVLSLALTGTEMTADIVTVRFRDAAGAQWADLLLTIHTATKQFEDIPSVDDLPTHAELATALGTADDAVIAAIAALNNLSAAQLAAADDATLAAIAALNNLSAAQVNAEVDTALADYDAPTKAELDAAVAPLATQASVNDLPTNAELATSQAAADDATLAAIAALNNLSAAAVNAEVDTALADVGLTTTITGRIDAAVSSRLASASYTAAPTVADILAGVIEGSITIKGALRLALAVLTGKSSGGGTATVVFRDTGDTKARVTATVTADGNRTAVTRDITD